jgi:hypothetical protein
MPGSTRPVKVLVSCQSRNIVDSGIAIASNGTRKLSTTTPNTRPRPRNWNAASPNAAVAQTARPMTTVAALTMIELRVARPISLFSRAE